MNNGKFNPGNNPIHFAFIKIMPKLHPEQSMDA